MGMDNSVITELISLARDNSARARRALSERVCELCLTGNEGKYQLSPEENQLAGEILIRLLREFEIDMRAQLAEKLAVSGIAPKQLIYALAMDEIIVAAPVIAQSPLLNEQDLIDVIKNKTRAHRLIVAGRPGISAAVSDALVFEREPDVISVLINNATAEIALAAMAYMVEESRSRASLQEAIIARADLPPQLAQKMLAFVSAELRRHILLNFDVEPETIDRALGQVNQEQALTGAARLKDSSNKAATLIDKLHASGELNVARVIAFLRERHLQLFYEGMAVLVRCDVQNLTHFASESEDKGLAVICRAAGADRGQFISAALLLKQAQGGDPAPASHLQYVCRLFDSLTEDRAHAVLEHWRTKTGGAQPASNAA